MKIPTKIYNYRLPYMGSKQNIAYSLMLAMVQKKPKAKYFFDIFGGGASMSIMAKQFGLKVYYTEKDGGIVNLLNFLKNNRIPKEWIKWIDREEFAKCIGKDDPYSVFVSIVWSFGNSRKAYLFGKDIENQKRLAFEVIVNQDYNCLNELNKLLRTKLTMPNDKTIQQRRLNFSKQIKTSAKRIAALERMEQIDKIAMTQSLTQLECAARLQQLGCLQQLGYLQQLEYLQQLGYLQQLEYLNGLDLPYDEVIIYCDPPYRNTEKYIENGFNYHEFDNWVKKLKYDCFISEYDCPFEKIASFGKMALLNNNKDKKPLISENLYFHKAENKM